MTTKAPTPPKPKATTGKPTVGKPTEKEFWGIIRDIQEQVSTRDFGSSVGQGGSELKNSHQLFHFVRPLMLEKELNVDIEPIDLNVTEVSNSIAIGGRYNAKWFLRGELVYETQTFGWFDTRNTAQATHGSATAAKTALYFNIFSASVKSDDKLEEDRQKELARQEKRNPAKPMTGGYGTNPY